MNDPACGFRPFPGNGAYGHWTCQRRRLHLGRHRFRNYTIARIPRIWHIRHLWTSYQVDHRCPTGKSGMGYRRALFPTKYEPT